MMKISPCLWFDSQAEEAAKFYVRIFKKSKIRKVSWRSRLRDPHEGQPFTALNGGPLFKFTEAVSLQIFCKTQKEVDYYWEKLTAGGDPSAQVCGWLKDKYGLSWQVVPTAAHKLLSDPKSKKSQRAFAAMMQMKKLDIAALKRAYEGK